jgi:HSP20 family molecular chaperone IbpA
MSSFLQKLKGKGVGVSEDHTVSPESLPEKSDIPSGVTQLPVDVKQSDTEIIIYAQVPGTEIKDLDVSIEGDNDVITIQGLSHRPEGVLSRAAEQKAANPGVLAEEHEGFTLEECVWGKFFRQIILPQEVDATLAEAKIKDGVLVLHLPLKGHSLNKMRMHVEKVDSSS